MFGMDFIDLGKPVSFTYSQEGQHPLPAVFYAVKQSKDFAPNPELRSVKAVVHFLRVPSFLLRLFYLCLKVR